MSKEIGKYNLPLLGELKLFETDEGEDRRINGRYFAHNLIIGYLGEDSPTKEQLYRNIKHDLARYLNDERKIVKEIMPLVKKTIKDFIGKNLQTQTPEVNLNQGEQN